MTKEKTIQMELRKADLAADDEEMTVSGYAAVFDQPAVMWHDPYSGIDYKESIGAHAFDKADLSNVVLRYNHNDSCEILARTSNGTLTLEADEKGLHIRAKLANTTLGRDVYELIKRKDITQMSFAFTAVGANLLQHTWAQLALLHHLLRGGAIELAQPSLQGDKSLGADQIALADD